MATLRANRQTKNKRAIIYLAVIAIVGLVLTGIGFVNLSPKTIPATTNAPLPSLK